MNPNKILILSHPRSGTSIIRDIIELYFKQKFNYISIKKSEPLNLTYYNGNQETARDNFFDILETEYYVVKYFMFMNTVLSTNELIDIIKREHITVYYLSRKSLSNLVISTVNAFANVWDKEKLSKSEINDKASKLVISDKNISEILQNLNITYRFYKQLNDLGLVKHELVYEDIDFNNLSDLLTLLFGTQNINIDTSTLRTKLLSVDTQNKIINNNNLDERIKKFLINSSD